jgi:5-methylcytosine-specific restriction endonuclease McrA
MILMSKKSKKLSLRFQVLKRDNNTCQYCGAKSPDAVLEVDHKIPRSKGGPDDLSNLITSCFPCNRGKRDKLITDTPETKKQKDAYSQGQWK